MQPHIRSKPARRRNPPPWGGSDSHAASAGADLEFGRFRVLLRRQLLADGVPVELGTRAFELLLVLLEGQRLARYERGAHERSGAGRRGGRREPEVQISALRKALGADRDLIRSEFGRGYRFIGLLRSDVVGDPGRRPMRSRAGSGLIFFTQSCRQSYPSLSSPREKVRQAPPPSFTPTVEENHQPHSDLSFVQRRGNVTRQAHSPAIKAAALAAWLGLSMLSYPLHAAPSTGGDTVQGLYDALLNTMKNGRILGQSGRFTRLEPVIRRSFDIASMARLSVGPSWTSLTEAQRQQMTESYARYISAIYADRFDSYAGQKLEVTGEQRAPSGVMVKSQIIKANGEPVKVDYLMRRNGDGWLISDIYLDGAISEVATRRSEFAAILKNDGIDGLITALNRKADLLTGTTASAL
jgi:phospholipid transport system substrate-binding protein